MKKAGVSRRILGCGFGGLLVLALPAVATAQEAEGDDMGDCQLVSDAITEPAVRALTEANEMADKGEAKSLYESALKDLESAINDDSNPTALWLAAEANIGLRKFKEADELLTRFTLIEPACAPRAENSRFNAWAELYNEAIQAYQAGDTEAALDVFLEANVIRKDSRSYNNAGLLYQNMGDENNAIEQFRLAASYGEPMDQAREASMNLSEALYASGKDDDALEALKEFSERHPDDMLAEMNYAIARVQAGDAEGAQETFSKLLGRDDLTVDQWNQVGVGLYQAEAFDDAASAFEKAHEMNPYDRDALNNLATASFEAGDYERSMALGEQLVEWYPYDFDAYTLLANSKSSTNDAGGALEIIQERGALAFSFQNVQLRARAQNAWVVEGEVMNRGDDDGTSITVPIEFLDPQGQVAATEQLQIVLPPSGETELFQVELTTDSPIAGFRYQKVASASES